MKLTIANLGPIKSASVDLNRLIIFVGPNNSGKSVVATTLYAVLPHPGIDVFLRSMRGTRAILGQTPEGDVTRAGKYLYQTALERPDAPAFEEIPKDVLATFEQLLANSLREYGEIALRELERVHGTSLSELRRAVSGPSRPIRASITLDIERPRWQISISAGARSRRVDLKPPRFEDLWKQWSSQGWGHLARRTEGLTNFPRSFLLRELTTDLARYCFREFPRRARYLPAARSGLMHAHRALSASIMQSSSLAGLMEMRIPTMTGVVADFLTEIIQLDPGSSGRRIERGRVERGAKTLRVEIAELLEREILHGTVDLHTNPLGYSEVLFRDSDEQYPLFRTSSMISELAPVVLYLRYVLGRGDLLVLEEPEAHLHPANQVAFARNIVRLTNRGTRTVLTTHSEFFVEKLNNSIVAESLDDNAALEAGFDDESRMRASRVSAYLFRPSSDGTLVRQLLVTPGEGIEEVGFEEVEERLYTENIVLAEGVSSGEK